MNDYREYVIKDGVFIGKFEEMYRDCEDPWEQTHDVMNNYSKMATIASVQRFGFKKILEIGCGLGHFTHFLQTTLPECSFVGMDISETAVNRARASFPDAKYVVGNITNTETIDMLGGYDTLLFTEIMWYVLDDLDRIIDRLKSTYSGKHIMINQTFYPGGQQKYGKDFFTTPEEMVKYFAMPLVEMVNANNNLGCHASHVVMKVE